MKIIPKKKLKKTWNSPKIVEIKKNIVLGGPPIKNGDAGAKRS